LHLPFDETWVPSETALARFDPELGWSYIPNHSAVQAFGNAQREVPMHFDAIGARVGTPGTPHSSTAPTVIFVGCSLTMGHGLPWEETFSGRLEGTPGFPLQVVNLGVQAYGTDQSLLLLRRHLREFNTKVVVYTFTNDHVARNGNDDRRLIFPHAKFPGTKPLFALTKAGHLVLREPPQRYTDMWAFHTWSYARLAWTRWGPAPDSALTRELVHAMRTFVEANGATFLVAPWPGSHFAFADPGLQEIDLGALVPPEFHGWLIPGDGHPDARANALVARILADRLNRVRVNSQAPSLRQAPHG
jgi:hypothetical protein